MISRGICLGLLLLVLFAPARAQSLAPAPVSPAPAEFADDLARAFPATTMSFAEFSDLGRFAADKRALHSAQTVLGSLGSAGLGVRVPTTLALMSPAEFAAILSARIAVGQIPKPTPAPPPAGRPARPPGTVDTWFVGIAKFPDAPASAKNRDSLLQLLDPSSANAKVIRTETLFDRPIEIRAMSAEPASPAYAFVGHSLVWGDLAGIAEVFAAAKLPEEKTLARRRAFAAAAGQLPSKRNLLVFSDYGPTIATLRAGFVGATDGTDKYAQLASAQWAFSGLESIRALGLAAQFDPVALRVEAYLEIDRTKAGLVPTFTNPPPIALRSPGFVPRDTDLFAAFGLDLQKVLELARHDPIGIATAILGLSSSDDANDMERTFRSAHALDLHDDVFDAFGPEIALAIKIPLDRASRSVASPEDGPSAISVVEVRRPEIFHALMAKLKTALPAKSAEALVPREYAGAELWRLGDRACALVDGYCVGGMYPAVLRALDARRAGITLASGPNFGAQTQYASKSLGGAVYVSPEATRMALREGLPLLPAGDLSPFVGTGQAMLLLVDTDETGLAFSATTLGGDPKIPVPSSTPEKRSQSITALNEEATLDTMRTICSAEAVYYSERGQYGTFENLVGENMLNARFRNGATADGYRLSLAPSFQGSGGFALTAAPVTYGETGARSFFANEEMVLRGADHKGGPATIEDQPIPVHVEETADIPVTPSGSGFVVPLVDVLRFLGSLSARETSAGYAMLDLVAAEATYQESKNRFADIDELVDARMLDESWKGGVRAGYRYTISIVDGDNGQSYMVGAVPDVYGETGRRSFLLVPGSNIRAADHGGDPATVDDPEIGPP